MRREEQSLQRSLVQLMRTCLPAGWRVVALRNNPRSAIAGGIERSMGAVAGVPDVAVFGRDIDERPATYLIEVKTAKGRLSPAQRAFHDALTDLGHPIAVVRSPEDVQALARKWRWPWRASAFAALLALASPAMGHGDWYHSVPECCSGQDCREAMTGEVVEVPGGYYIAPSGEGVGYRDPKLRPSPDGKVHRCLRNPKDPASPTICLFVVGHGS